MKNSKGFTLIELLVVMAISVILMGLVLGPVIKSFEFTRQAQSMVQAQDSARFAMEQISRELSSAMYVYDNNNSMIYNGSRSMIRIPIDDHGGSMQLPYGHIDFVLPKMTMHCNSPNHPADSPRDYPRGDEAWPSCPVCNSDDVEARPKLPMEQDVTIVRYFLGLKYNVPPGDPTADPPAYWQSPMDNNVEPGMENQVVLYRIEINLGDTSIFPATTTMAERQAIINDALFFYNAAPAAGGRRYCDHWARIARVVGMGKYEDLVTATMQGNTIAALSPTVTFRMAQIDNDTFTGTYSSDKANEQPDAVPAVYSAKYGYWTGSNTVAVYRDNYNTAFSTYVRHSDDHVIIQKWTGPNWSGSNQDEFDITEYLNSGSLACMQSTDLEMAFTYDTNKGTINFALNPPNMPLRLDNAAINSINDTFDTDYNTDRGSAQRKYQIDLSACKNATIVPGSEVITGPDMTPKRDGSPITQGTEIKYERVPEVLGNAGLNQYKIDYATGMVYFCSDYDQKIPVLKDANNNPINITIRYKIQFNKSGDVVRGDYGTKSLVNIHLGMRMFDPDSGKPFPVDLNNSVKIQNALR